MIKKHKSTVLSLDWCPNNKLLVTGSSDYKCRIASAFIKNLDTPEEEPFGAIWPKQDVFGEILVEFDQAKAWVNSVSWSPSGFRLAFAGHGSTVHFVQIVADGKPLVQTIYDEQLPYKDISFVDDNTVVATGWSLNPAVFKASGDAASPTWAFDKVLDPCTVAVKRATSARAIFQNADSRGNKGAGGSDTLIPTKHKNLISSLQVISPTEITTSGYGGRIFYWTL
jgi:actin related protein 2/3 complex subunit 1A/1B